MLSGWCLTDQIELRAKRCWAAFKAHSRNKIIEMIHFFASIKYTFISITFIWILRDKNFHHRNYSYSSRRAHGIRWCFSFENNVSKSESWLNSDNFNDKYPPHNTARAQSFVCIYLHKCTQIRWNSLISHTFVLWMRIFGMTRNISILFFAFDPHQHNERGRKMCSNFTGCCEPSFVFP